jgi:pimeloyl-ACP methyl ester carboxylesterase
MSVNREKKGFGALTLSTVAISLTLAGCGGGGGDPGANPLTLDTSGARGALISAPPPVATFLIASEFNASLSGSASGQSILQLAGTPTCDVAIHKLEYSTVDGAGNQAQASAAVMIPTASSNPTVQAASCVGARPVVLYAHGTTVEKEFNIANLADASGAATGEVNAGSGQATLLAALFAAQGYVVIAPNFVGYDSSTTSYHPFVNHDQQAKDMVDSLAAGRKALASLASTYRSTDSGKLFITGFSQGGSVAMATQKLMQASNLSYTAAAPISGAYRLSSFFDAIFSGYTTGPTPLIPVGGPVFATMVIESYLNSYGLAVDRDDVYNSKFRSGIESLIPSATKDFGGLLDNTSLPVSALFEPKDPIEDALGQATGLFDSTNFLIKSTFRTAYLTNTGSAALLRAKVAENDLSTFVPSKPTFLCAGGGDPVVFTGTNHDAMETAYAGLPAGLVTTLDLQDTPAGAFAQLQGGFQALQATYTTPTSALLAYHGNVVPFCLTGVRAFFSNF